MTELSFLIDLLLNHELQKPTKDAIADRIKEVESKLTTNGAGSHGSHLQSWNNQLPQNVPQQAASTLALMAKHGDIPYIASPPMPPIPKTEPVAQIAQTVATAAAMMSRNAAISDSIAGKTDKSTGRPRKF